MMLLRMMTVHHRDYPSNMGMSCIYSMVVMRSGGKLLWLEAMLMMDLKDSFQARRGVHVCVYMCVCACVCVCVCVCAFVHALHAC